MRFIATSDWQLGMTAHYLDDDARPRYRQARFDAVRRIGELAREREAAFVVVAGDIFESNQLDRRVVSRTFEALRDYPCPVVLVPGNHDPLDASSIYDAPSFVDRRPAHVHVLRDAAPFAVVEGAQVVGAPWRSKRPLTDLMGEACAQLAPAEDGVVRVLVGHGAVSTLSPDRDNPAVIDVPALSRAIDDGKIHVAIVGDRHSTTEVAPGIWYPGTPEVTDRTETEPGNALVIDVVPDEPPRVEPVHVGTWAFGVLEAELAGPDDVLRLAERLDAMDDKARTALWLVLRGTLSTADYAELERVIEERAELFAKLAHWERHHDVAVLPADGDFSDLGLTGFAQSALQELAGVAAGDGDEASTAQDALALLYRLAGGSR